MRKWGFRSLVTVYLLFFTLNGFAEPKKINILWGQFSRKWTLSLVANELSKPLKLSDHEPGAQVQTLDLTALQGNPFDITPTDFFVGFSRPDSGLNPGPVPAITAQQAAWFDQAVEQGLLPDVFVIAGHQVISEGWHSHDEKEFMFLPTLLQTLQTYPSAKKIFDHVRLAILWGCNTMTNLEPHGPHGEYLSPEQIKSLYDSGPKGKLAAIGSENQVNTLEFYRSRLAREYGPPETPTHKYEYTRSKNEEDCLEKPYGLCAVTNLDRIMPDQYLWDGSHLYNYPYMMKRVFPQAALVLGFSSASPDEEVRVRILKATLDKSYSDLNAHFKPMKKSINNILFPLVDPSSPVELQKEIIKSIRTNWTLMTDRMNRGRPSGSISPIYPDLDRESILGAALTRGSHQYGPYESASDTLVEFAQQRP